MVRFVMAFEDDEAPEDVARVSIDADALESAASFEKVNRSVLAIFWKLVGAIDAFPVPTEGQ